MSNIEHLIESAVECLEHSYTFDEWKESWFTNTNKQNVKAPLEEIWGMAVWVYYDYRPYIEWKVTQKLEQEYGYKV